MKILVIAPQPFFQERGTPIAVDLLVQHLTKQHQVDLLVFNEGESRQYNGLTIHRVNSIPKLTGIKPGFSLKKLYLNVWLLIKFIKLLLQNRYDVVHAVEESAFFALIFKPIFRYQFVQDIDSNMTTQLVDKAPILKGIRPVFRFIESLPMRFADAVVPVCEALANEVKHYRNNRVFLLKDIALTDSEQSRAFAKQNNEQIRSLLPHPDLPLFMYIGNLESYQGIDLLMNSFAQLCESGHEKANLVIIGGEQKDIEHYQQLCCQLHIEKHVVFAGKRPVAGLDHYMQQADILVSPRTQGSNTPMKIYSYLASGKAVIATRLETHTQVMNDKIAILANANIDDYSQAMRYAIKNRHLLGEMTSQAKAYIQREHSQTAFNQQVDLIYQSLNKQSS